MRAFIKKALKVVTHAQILAVFLAFALMIIFASNFMGGIERQHLLKDVDNAISSTQAYIEADLLEPETALVVAAESIKNMITRGESADAVRNYIRSVTTYLLVDERLASFVSAVYGYFDVFDGLFVPGTDWVPSDDYSPFERPWFHAAVNADGKVAVTEPHINASNGDTILTFSRCIFDDYGRRMGIICLDISVKRIQSYAVNTYITSDSYGVLFDKNLNIIAHPNPVFVGRHISFFNDGLALHNEISMNAEISERKYKDYLGNDSVLFTRQLKNGWYLAIIAHSKVYYKGVYDIAVILTLIGSLLAVTLSVVLLSIVASKKKAEERTQIMLDATPLAVCYWGKDFTVIDCNKETLNLFGLSSKREFLDNFFSFSPEYQPDGRKSMERAIELIVKAFHEGYLRFEWLHRLLNGGLIPCEITLVRVIYGNEPTVCEYVRDLRELKNMMAKTREADECTQVLFDATPLSCFMIDNLLNVLECNQEILRLFDLAEKRIFIENFFDFFPEYQPSGELSKTKIFKYAGEAFQDGFCRFEWIHQTLRGEVIPTDVTFVRVKYRGVYAIAAYVRDLRELKAIVSEMRRAEIAEEGSKAKSDFLAKMSHEIRTPMNAILGIAEIQLQDNSLPKNVNEALRRIYNSGNLLLGIINDILDLSKIEAGKLELVNENYDVASLIYDVAQLNIMRYESKPIQFKLNVSEKVPSVLKGDELRIKQVLNNILSNAFKYTSEGMVEMSVLTEPEDRKEGENVILVIIVRDTGQGMTNDQVHRLGSEYSRFNAEANRMTEGTGLGMNITRNLISMMGGELLIDSIPGMGTTFSVFLPQDDAGFFVLGKEWALNLEQLNLKNTEKMRYAQITREFMPYGSVLIVDDVETNLYVARGLLAPYGLSVDTALSGFEAVEKIRSGSVYDIIFMDHMMPKMDGIEALKIIRGLGYNHPIIALTANALIGQAERFMENGFDDFISKPIDIRHMNSILNKVIRDKQTPETLEAARQKKNALRASGNYNADLNMDLAEIFTRDARKASDALNAIYKNKCRRAEDVDSFIINVHAMKSALANIGEHEVSAEAAALEQAGRKKNIDLILAEIPVFLNVLEEVIEKVKPKEKEPDAEMVDENSEEIRAFLREKLLVIQAACSRYDKKAAKEILAELKRKTWSQATKERFDVMSERLLHSEFEEAAVIAKEIFPY